MRDFHLFKACARALDATISSLELESNNKEAIEIVETITTLLYDLSSAALDGEIADIQREVMKLEREG